MEPAKIDWKNIDSTFIEDEVYEHISAPKWVDFSAPEDHVDDEAWFCRTDCRHPKSVEDFIRSTPSPKVKYMRSSTVLETLPLRNRNLRDGNMKRGGNAEPSNSPVSEKKLNKPKMHKPPNKYEEGQENENPNSNQQKNIVKQGMEKRKPFEKSTAAESGQEERKPKLKSTLSASNLFAGKEIISHITEFCSELKKLVTRAKERENLNKKRSPKKKLSEASMDDNVTGLNEKEKEKKPLLEVEKGDSQAMKKSNEKEKQRKLNTGEIENIQLPKVIGHSQAETVFQVRTNPPSPQCFSAYREPLRRTKATTPLKPSKSIPTDKSTLQEVEQNNRVETEKSPAGNANNKNISPAGKEARSMEMFWLLKPCIAN